LTSCYTFFNAENSEDQGTQRKNGKYLVLLRPRVLKVDEFVAAAAQGLNFAVGG